MSLPLSNLRIIDLGWAMAGPQATRLLATSAPT
jgi:crotonobetainyl-CoA:carnitine CoA-transferase CaiB-like acyl-CoA transferase